MEATITDGSCTKRTILVVDDAGLVRMRCRRFLVEGGYEVIEAQNGLEAVATYQRERPDAVLLDVTMPEMDGITALKEIRKLDPDANVVMVTGMRQQAVIVDALKSGARDFVQKPFDPEHVLLAVEKLFC